MTRSVRRAIVAALAGGTAACGAEPAGPRLEVGFAVHALECDRPGMLAYLQVTGVPGICPLTVNDDRTVTGVCSPVPTGAIREFRLVYYTRDRDREVLLASATVSLDLRSETRSTVVLEFPPERVVTDFDDDEDGRTNLEEFCSEELGDD